jgi:hypothetical protein
VVLGGRGPALLDPDLAAHYGVDSPFELIEFDVVLNPIERSDTTV